MRENEEGFWWEHVVEGARRDFEEIVLKIEGGDSRVIWGRAEDADCRPRIVPKERKREGLMHERGDAECTGVQGGDGEASSVNKGECEEVRLEDKEGKDAAVTAREGGQEGEGGGGEGRDDEEAGRSERQEDPDAGKDEGVEDAILSAGHAFTLASAEGDASNDSDAGGIEPTPLRGDEVDSGSDTCGGGGVGGDVRGRGGAEGEGKPNGFDYADEEDEDDVTESKKQQVDGEEVVHFHLEGSKSSGLAAASTFPAAGRSKGIVITTAAPAASTVDQHGGRKELGDVDAHLLLGGHVVTSSSPSPPAGRGCSTGDAVAVGGPGRDYVGRSSTSGGGQSAGASTSSSGLVTVPVIQNGGVGNGEVGNGENGGSTRMAAAVHDEGRDESTAPSLGWPHEIGKGKVGVCGMGDTMTDDRQRIEELEAELEWTQHALKTRRMMLKRGSTGGGMSTPPATPPKPWVGGRVSLERDLGDY
jgi:hypothetical protein